MHLRKKVSAFAENHVNWNFLESVIEPDSSESPCALKPLKETDMSKIIAALVASLFAASAFAAEPQSAPATASAPAASASMAASASAPVHKAAKKHKKAASASASAAASAAPAASK
jgi:hypothetical protein